VLFRLGFSYKNVANKRFAILYRGSVTSRDAGQMGEFHSLHRRFDSSQGHSANHDLMSGKRQPEPLFFFVGFKLGKDELVKGQHQGVFGRDFNS